MKVVNIVSCLPHVVFLENSKEKLEVVNILLVFNKFLFSSIRKEVKVVSIPLFSTLFCLVEREKQKLQTSFTNTKCLYIFAKNKACDPPYLVWSQETSMLLLLPSWSFVWLSIWFSFGVLLLLGTRHYWLPYYLGSFDTNYIIFRNVWNFPQKKILIKEKKWNKILNLQEYSICQNENFKMN